MRRRQPKSGPTEVVTGLAISRKTEPWQGNGFRTWTRWTARHNGILIGEWNADAMTSGWAFVNGERVSGVWLWLRQWRAAVVAEARRREATR